MKCIYFIIFEGLKVIIVSDDIMMMVVVAVMVVLVMMKMVMLIGKWFFYCLWRTKCVFIWL